MHRGSLAVESSAMKTVTALICQVGILLVGLGVLALLLWEPHLEGRNVHATTFEIYFKDPFLAYVYVGSTPFFIALYRAFALFGDVRRTQAFSPRTVDALRSIQRCAITLIGFVVGGIVFIILFGDGDDRPAGVFMGLLIASAATVVAVVAAMTARNLQRPIGSRDVVQTQQS